MHQNRTGDDHHAIDERRHLLDFNGDILSHELASLSFSRLCQARALTAQTRTSSTTGITLVVFASYCANPGNSLA